jgi:hypothetical protein
MKNLFKMLLNIRGAREFPDLTKFLVENPAFRHMAMKVHSTQKNAVDNLEKYLDKEILGKEHVEPEKPKGINTRGRNTKQANESRRPESPHRKH